MKYKKLVPRRKKQGKKSKGAGKNRFRPTRLHALVAFIVLIGVGFFVIHIISGLPSLNQLDHPKPEFSSKVYSADGVLIGQYSIVNRSRVSFDELPPFLINALIASEDRKFYRHRGIDPDRILKAAIKNIISFRIREGASTITQQVARNLYLNHEQSFSRKIREVITAFQIERRYSKNEILEMYFNLAFFGNSAYGVAAATDRYFDKSVSELTLTDSALLIGILPNPTRYDPYIFPERAMTRRNIVLNAMLSMEFISPDVANRASAYPMELTDSESTADSDIAPHFVEYVRRQLSDLAIRYGFDIYRDGLVVHTTLDSRMQRHANRAVTDHLAAYQRTFDREWSWNTPERHSMLQSALEREVRNHPAYRKADSDTQREKVRTELLTNEKFISDVKDRLKTVQTGFVAIDPRTGEIKSMVGGSDANRNKYGLNRVTQIRRQPGSAFKPFIYTVAIDNGYPPLYQLPNEAVTITTRDGTLWEPENADGITGGEISLRDGLALSINLVAVRTMMNVAPVDKVIEYAHRMGITSHLHSYESLSLGTAEVSPLEITSAYGVYATNGIYNKPVAIRRIEDSRGNIIVSFQPEQKQVLKPETAYIMTDMLRDVIQSGTGKAVQAYIDFPAAGKTGTTQGYADGWFIGYTPDLVAGAWVGFDDRRITLSGTDGQGARSALPIWARFMKTVYDDNTLAMPITDFEMPSGVKRVAVCPESRMLATKNCPESIDEVMFENHLPNECDRHQSFFRSVRTFISRLFK
jgi:penicillin-binding protein 1A